MKLSDEEVSELKAYLKQKHDERMQQIEEFKCENEISGQSRILKK